MGATFRDEDGETQPLVMGCYGLGVTRLLACVLEQHHDDDGIIWPTSIAPYAYYVVGCGQRRGGARRPPSALYDAWRGVHALR